MAEEQCQRNILSINVLRSYVIWTDWKNIKS